MVVTVDLVALEVLVDQKGWVVVAIVVHFFDVVDLVVLLVLLVPVLQQSLAFELDNLFFLLLTE